MYILYWHIVGTVFTIILGSLLHFTYKWSGHKTVVALFSTINESTWEHLKLLITPIILFGLIEYIFYGRFIGNFIPIKIASILIGMVTIIVVFYTYSGIMGKNYLIIDINTFNLSVIIAYLFSFEYLDSPVLASGISITLGWIILCLLILFVVICTFSPPRIGLFKDPKTGGYGLKGK